LKNKSDLKSKIMTLLNDLKIAGINVKFIRCNDSAENKALFEAFQAQGYGGNSRLSLEESELC
jgi:hypothetical protein